MFGVIVSSFALISAFAASDTASAQEFICRPTAERAIKSAIGAPVYLTRKAGKDQLYRFQGTTDRNNSIVSAKFQAASLDDARALCDSGFEVAVLQLPAEGATRVGQKSVVPPQTSLPSSFTITGLYSLTWGNFWVPNPLPNGHTYQVVDFTVAPYNYAASGAYSHFAATTLTVSNSNFDADFDGKGAIFSGGYMGCTSPVTASALQSWAIQGYSDANGCLYATSCENPVFNGSAPAPWQYEPNTCASWDNSATTRFMVGANTSQQSVYWRCPASGACPGYVSPSVNSYSSNFRGGGAGVAFLHVLGDSGSVWSLSFTNVSTYTGP